MTFRPLLTLALISATASVHAGQAPVLSEAGLAKRAGLFSNVCMASAPRFDEFEAHAAEAGLTKGVQGWSGGEDYLIGLIEHDGFCSCFLTMKADDQARATQALHAQLMADFGASYSGPENGLAAVAPFDRDGIEVVSIIEPRSFNEAPWIAARVSVFGACPVQEGTE
jgi:hypothetical protein